MTEAKEQTVSEMVDRVADIIANGIADDLPSEEIATKVIRVMREPTEAMVRACTWPNTDWNSSLEDVWRCMIDGALK
jgi:hypothetical protein